MAPSSNFHELNKHQLEQDDKAYIWHPFTQMRDWLEEKPVIIGSGEGNYLIDIEGKRYIDGVSSLWTNVHGHRHPTIDGAVKDQLDKIAHSTMLGLSSVPAIQLARQLVDIAPEGLTKVFYSDNGSTAVEIALKMAFQFHQQAGGSSRKTRFMTMTNAYHGDTIGSVSVGGIDLFHQIYSPLLFDTIQVDSAYCYRCPVGKSYPGCSFDCLNQMEEKMKAQGNEICALIIEPLVQGAAGLLVQPPGYLQQVRELCSRYNILMIADEVAVGFGKTGSMFACEKEGVRPDLMALAKGISGGYLPLAATLASDAVFDGFLGRYEEFKTFFHGHTYTGNPLACAAALASLHVFTEEQVLENLAVTIDRLSTRLEGLQSLAHVGDIRQCGIMTGIELVADAGSKTPYDPELKIGHKVIVEARRQGLMIRPLGNVIILMPPLSISAEELDRMCEITYESIKTVTESDAH